MSNNILRDRSKDFAKKIVFLSRKMRPDRSEYILINQVIRSSTSIGANIHEARYAQSPKDFVSKLEIAQKECYETEYWLELLLETECIDEKDYRSLNHDCGAIRRMLITSIKTVKQKYKL